MKKFEGHINIGKRITIYGDNAMHYAINIRTKRFGYICFHPTVGRWKWYFYLSPNATPWAATYAKGPGLRASDKHLAPVRKTLFGHNFDTEKNRDALYELNNTYSEADAFFNERLGRNRTMLDKFGKLVRDIRITRSLLLYDMAKTLDIFPAELSAIECGRKPVPDWFVPALEKHYGIGETCAHMLRVLAEKRGD